MEWRKPEKVSSNDCITKYKKYSKLKFSEEEVEFFNKFSELNKDHSSTLNNDFNWGHIFDPNFKIIKNTGGVVTIIKLDDNWYLITPLTVTQREDYSDIEKRQTNYTRVMIDLDKEWMFNSQTRRPLSPRSSQVSPRSSHHLNLKQMFTK